MTAILLGFFISMAIALTGVGAGTITAPALILWLGVSPATAVGTALTFGAAVKIPAALTYLRKRLVHWPTALAMLAGGVPGVLAGSVLLETLDQEQLEGYVLLGVGAVVASTALFALSRMFLQRKRPPPARSKYRLVRLGLLCVPIGLEVGFSSAGAGALGTLAIMHATPLVPAAVVGTDIVFGLGLSSLGGGFHLAFGSFDSQLLLKLIGGGLVGSVVGANLAGFVPARVLRVALLVWLSYIGITLTYKGYQRFDSQRDAAAAAVQTANPPGDSIVPASIAPASR